MCKRLHLGNGRENDGKMGVTTAAPPDPGRDAAMSGMATLSDVARRAGVSTATVSRVLNTPARVKPATREKVEAVVAALGYTPHFAGRALASNRSDTIGAIIPTMENAIFARGVQALEEALSEAGVTLLVATSHYSAATEAQKLRALLTRGVDAVALIGHERPEATWRMLAARATPHVTLWAAGPGGRGPFAGFDNAAAARLMADLVLDHGHRRIAILSGPVAGNDRAAGRLAGSRAALAARGVAPAAVVETPYDIGGAAAAAGAILAADPRPTVIVCGNDVLAAGALQAVKEAGLSAPGDVSVTGFDDIDLAAVVEPALTTIRAPHRAMGLAAAEMLRALVAGEDAPSRTLPVALVRRASLSRIGPAVARGAKTP